MSAGQLGASGFQKGGLTGVVLASPELRVTVHPIPRLADCQARAAEIGAEVAHERRLSMPGSHAFGLLLVDGLARMEERLAAALYQSLDSVPLVGGSAGDDLGCVRTHVLCGQELVDGAAVLGVFHTTLPFHPFKFQHHVAGDRPIVVTATDPEQRRVLEIDGEPAADVYARLVGVPREQLDASVFSRHPLVLRLGGEPYIRSIPRANTDASLTLYCAIDEGLVLTVGRGTDPLEAARRAFADARARVGQPKVVLGCDCILRRLELSVTIEAKLRAVIPTQRDQAVRSARDARALLSDAAATSDADIAQMVDGFLMHLDESLAGDASERRAFFLETVMPGLVANGTSDKMRRIRAVLS